MHAAKTSSKGKELIVCLFRQATGTHIINFMSLSFHRAKLIGSDRSKYILVSNSVFLKHDGPLVQQDHLVKLPTLKYFENDQ